MSARSGASRPPETPTGEKLAFGAVHLDVTDATHSLGFWHDIVGLRMLGEAEDGGLRLGAGDRELVVLHPGAERGALRGHSGLYHLAIHLPDETEFARVLWKLIVAGCPQAPTDHTMSKSTYLTDPDGLGVEMTLETPERLESALSDPDVPKMTELLDVNEALSHLSGRDFDQPLLPAGTKIGHIHLHVSDLDEALHFYRDLIGFEEHMYTPEYGFADLGAGGRFPHRMALNVWAGEGARPAPEGTARLRRFTLVLRGDDELSALRRRLAGAGYEFREASGGMEVVHDPAGNAIALEAGPQ